MYAIDNDKSMIDYCINNHAGSHINFYNVDFGQELVYNDTLSAMKGKVSLINIIQDSTRTEGLSIFYVVFKKEFLLFA